MSRAGPPRGSCVNLSAGPSVSDIISRGGGKGEARANFLKKLHEPARFLFFSFHLSAAASILLAPVPPFYFPRPPPNISVDTAYFVYVLSWRGGRYLSTSDAAISRPKLYSLKIAFFAFPRGSLTRV